MRRQEVEAVKIIQRKAASMPSFTVEDLHAELINTNLSDIEKDTAIDYFLTSTVVKKLGTNKYKCTG